MQLDKLCGAVLFQDLPVEAQRVVGAQLDTLDQYPLVMRANGETSKGKRFCFFDLEKQMFGKFLPTTYQRIGSCVGHGGFQAIWRRILAQVSSGSPEQWLMPYLPYMYAASRMLGTQKYGIRWGNDPSGSMGYLFAEAVQTYGWLPNDTRFKQPTQKTDQASGNDYLDWPGEADSQWATSPFVPSDVQTLGKKQLFDKVYKVSSYEQLRDAIVIDKAAVTVAWNFDLHPSESKNGKVWLRRGRIIGGHQVCFLGVDDDSQDPGAFLQNSWSPSWMKQTDGPSGAGWTRAEDVDDILRRAECYALANEVGVPEQRQPLDIT